MLHTSKYKVHKLHQRHSTVGGVHVPYVLLAFQVRVTVGDSGLCSCVPCYTCDVYRA